jgi:hypothetical protein
LPLRYNQYGGSIGGPAIKNRTFGFFNWEGVPAAAEHAAVFDGAD